MKLESLTRYWVTLLMLTLCVAVWIGLAVQDDYETWSALSRFGYESCQSIWSGAYWALVTSAFVHFEVVHCALNVYWLWVLGKPMELAIGSVRYLAFVVVAAIVSSALQLAVSDGTGIGASGVVYAIFGFMWLARPHYPRFREVLDDATVRFFLVWLIACVVLTELDIMHVGNAAHLSGLLIGAALAGFLEKGIKRASLLAASAAMLALSIVPLFWCPWSVEWLSHVGYAAHVEKRYDLAVRRYSQILDRDSSNAWAYLNRSYAFEAQGKHEEAAADMAKAHALGGDLQDGK